MIGVIAKEYQKPAVLEFFELFKVPWEFYNRERTYDVIIATDSDVTLPPAKLIIVFGSETTPFDGEHGIRHLSHVGSTTILEHGSLRYPIYRGLAVFDDFPGTFIGTGDVEGGQAGILFDRDEGRILRIGYDLFDEIYFHLTKGQPADHALSPTVEVHISLLRSWILGAGLALFEIPPTPAGYRFIACLTHDVDFIAIRDHIFDRSLFGFIYRVFFPPTLRDWGRKISWSRVFKNLRAFLSLPGVYLGFFRDFWFQLNRFLEIEKGIPSTFFFIPIKNHPGDDGERISPGHRAARYDVNDYRNQLIDLKGRGHEIGVHGIDAWQDSRKGRRELEFIRDITGDDKPGVRMHWLYFAENSPGMLEDAGFQYDSSLGYNDAVGYRSGTSQVFRLPGSSKVFELPLHVQDTAMFYPKRMGLGQPAALALCKKLIGDRGIYGGVLTVNWHQRSLGPERNWDDFYIELLRMLKAENVWFATAKQVVSWFRRRRSIFFGNVDYAGQKVRLRIGSGGEDTFPCMTLRVHHPRVRLEGSVGLDPDEKSYTDVPLKGIPEMEFSFGTV